MDLSGLLQGIERAPSFSRLREAVAAGRAQTGGRLPGLVIGVGDAAKAAAIAVLAGGAARFAPAGSLPRLSALGYSIEPLVERPGQASRRGGIVDVFPPPAEAPLRGEPLGRGGGGPRA